MSRRSSLIRRLTLASFIPLALSVVWLAVTGRDSLAGAGLLVLLDSGGLLSAPLLLLGRGPPAIGRQASDLYRTPELPRYS